MRTILLILLAISLSGLTGCGKRVELKQEVSLDSYVDDTYYVDSKIWIYDGSEPISIEKSIFASDVEKADIEKMKAEHRTRLQPMYQRCLDSINWEGE